MSPFSIETQTVLSVEGRGKLYDTPVELHLCGGKLGRINIKVPKFLLDAAQLKISKKQTRNQMFC